MKVIFLDTNVFMQCKELTDLPWQDIAEGHDLLLLIPRAVQEEIDKHKSEGNTRRGKRSRKVSTFFRDIILSENTLLCLKDCSPRIEVSFPDFQGNSNTVSTNAAHFDLSRPDDRIVNEVMHFMLENPHLSVFLLTHDTNPMLTCKRASIPYIVVPDGWLLSPEPDSREKRINELEQKLRNLEQIHPRIEVVCLKENEKVTSMTLQVPISKDLSDSEIDEYVVRSNSRRPMKSNYDDKRSKNPAPHSAAASMLGFQWVYEEVSEAAIDEYETVLYPTWLQDLRAFYGRLSSTISFPDRHCLLNVQLSNNGSVPAENVIVEFKTVGGLLMVTPEGKEELYGSVKIEPPAPPKAPEGRWVQRKTRLSIFDGINPLANRIEGISHPPINFSPRQRDRNAFYWKDAESKHYSQEWAFECQEFRHKVGAETFQVVVFVPPKVKVGKAGISILITAKNLPEPVQAFLPIHVTYEHVDINVIAEKLLSDHLPVFE